MTRAVELAQVASNGVSEAFKNRIINGAMTIDQRNAGASVTPTTSGQYNLDRWQVYNSQSSKFSVQQNAGSVTPPAGFSNYLGATSLSAYSITSGDYFTIGQPIEGFNVADLNWGTANAKTITISFWVRSSLTGTFGACVTNSAFDRSYPFSYTINSANTWEYETITIAGDTSGTWLTNNGRGIELDFGIGVGSSNSGTAGSWQSGWKPSVTGAVSVVGTNGATFYITGVQLEVGSTATSFDYRPYTTELQLCYRYYYRLVTGSADPISTAAAYNSNTSFGVVPFPVTMRTLPDIDQSSVSNQFLVTGSNSGGVSFTTFGYNERGTNTITLYNVNNASVTQGYAYWFRCNSSTSGQKLAFTAEL